MRHFGNKRLKFQIKWTELYPWLTYSPKKVGVFCKFCLLFNNEGAGKGSHESPGALVTSAFTDWKHALEQFRAHAKTQCHSNSAISANNFQNVSSGKQDDITIQLNQQLKDEIEQNRRVLTSTINIFIFCGGKALALQGDDECGPISFGKPRHNDGNFRALLRFSVD